MFERKWRLKYKYIAIDFDGTIADEEMFPTIGAPILNAIWVIQKIKEYGGKICIWTCRSNADLSHAMEFLSHHEVPFDYLNQDFPEIAGKYHGFTRKVCADVYIDNKDIHCIGKGGIDWEYIHNILFERIK